MINRLWSPGKTLTYPPSSNKCPSTGSQSGGRYPDNDILALTYRHRVPMTKIEADDQWCQQPMWLWRSTWWSSMLLWWSTWLSMSFWWLVWWSHMMLINVTLMINMMIINVIMMISTISEIDMTIVCQSYQYNDHFDVQYNYAFQCDLIISII